MMSDTTNTAIKKALKESPNATAGDVAGAASISPSTARKVLAQLVEAGEVSRVEGGREAGRRLPDRYSLNGTLVPESSATHSVTESGDTAGKGSEPAPTEPTASSKSGAQVKAADRGNPESKAEAAGRQSGPREGSTMWAAIKVLREKGKPMRAAEIYAEIRERDLAPGLKGKTPEQTVAAQLAVHVKRGLYVERPKPGKFQLRNQ
jgi:HB1, ASXL, restriction endonuclease HTH domain